MTLGKLFTPMCLDTNSFCYHTESLNWVPVPLAVLLLLLLLLKFCQCRWYCFCFCLTNLVLLAVCVHGVCAVVLCA